MLPESTNGTSGGGLAVPMAWLCAEFTADDLLRASCLVPPGSLEYRAGRQTLALTIHLCEGADASSGTRTTGRLDEWMARTAYDRPWPRWVRERLAARVHAGEESPDLAMAHETWRQLRATQVRAADLGGLPSATTGLPVDESAQVWLPAWKLGLPLGHLALHLY
ncbi:hypothetical protein J7E93_27750 [Streptomyces sp. ISL-36]|uniref:hypothetical protein n=1 Tax=Streptomyces sp. ISL-36 TaxID=2819182 RepID=UPI001BE57994|nr:hypothetical protein [Streptomyces sp. ISL-36]MBT2443825.1 hypothetical protein [Streptomyces sp. ISL-36]